ncbi:MAG: hypothetical protein ACR2MM_09985 [Flavobacteriaceae bacterium]
MEKHYRYPGARSFTEKDSELFFGRKTETRELAELVVLEKMVVLFGKSGYGKTSLLNAGVIPRLKQKEAHSVLEICLRLPEEPEVNPVEQMLEQLKQQAEEDSFLSDKLDIEAELPLENSAKLWYFTKRIQLREENSKAITLVFDHFGKLFVYRELQAKAFGRTLANLLNPRPPKAVRRLIKAKIKSDPDYFTESEIDQLFEPLNLKVVISISHDQLGSLDMLKPVLPAIFKYTYELQPLNEYQAVEVLQKPAKMKGKFASPEFTYSKAAINKILKSLKDKRTKRIETFQLQLIGQHAEEIIIAKKEKTGMSELELTDTELGKPEKLFEDHYNGIIGGLPVQKGKARNLVENALIVDGNRVPVADRIISAKYLVKKELLDILVDKRLLRSERNSVGGLSYELCHDTLIAPIQKSATSRRQKVLLRNLLFVGLALLLFTVSSASWAVIMTNKADNLEGEIDSLKNEKNKAANLQSEIDSLNKVIEDINEGAGGQGQEAAGTDDGNGTPGSGTGVSGNGTGGSGNGTGGSGAGSEGSGNGTGGSGNGTGNGGSGNGGSGEGIVISAVDSDEDGIPNGEDRCPYALGPIELKGCPDKDGDDIPDIDDLCLNEVGLAKFKGCPDNDGDEIPDIADQCPKVAGLAEFNGCPGPDIFPKISFEDAYLIAISKPALVPRIFDAKRNDALYILINGEKKYMFWGFTSQVNPEAGGNINGADSLSVAQMSTAQLKDSIESTHQVRVLNTERDWDLSFQDCDGSQTTRIPFFSKQRYIDSDGTIQIAENNQNAYQKFIDLLRRPSEEDCIYYTYLDWTDFDSESRNKITNVLNRLKAVAQ